MNKFLANIILAFFSLFALAQSEGNELYEHRLDENKWNEIREGIRYEGQPDGPGREWTYESAEEYRRAQRKYNQGNGNGNGNGSGGQGQGDGGNYDGAKYERADESTYTPPRIRSSPSTSVFNGLGIIGYILLGVFIVALAFLIYYMYLNRQKGNTKVGEPINFDEVAPTEIPLTELERMLHEALAKGDYRGAIRIYFIFIIRDLANKRWINWEKEKTNFHYLREMSGKNEFDDFNKSVSYFEIIWYGKRELDSATFEQIKPNFTRFLDKLGVK